MSDDPEIQKFLEQQAGAARISAAALSFTELCWEKCVDKVGSKPITESGDSRTASCFSNCVARFLDTSELIVKRLQSKSA
eukprot:m.18024 g.18024  ORF g.18024 m.18024 type:complete len:80 (-) comp10736_c0_seq1:407-646(-)